jgi:predicted nucleic-acid-binding Zn-ribbon protein
MKTTGKCPKCGSSEILRISGRVGPFGSGNNIPLGATIFSAIPVSRYLCSHCGYSEEWVDSDSDLQKLRDKYRP